MEIESKESLNLVFQGVVVNDVYDFRKFPPNFFENIIDIGAYVGYFSIFARFLQPKARILAYEPCKRNYHKLVKNTRNLNIQTFRKALGCGDFLSELKKDVSGRYANLPGHAAEFISEKNRKKSLLWRMLAEPIKSFRLQELVNIKDLGDNYCLKIDCEGGEASLIDDEEAEKIIRGAAHAAIEIHCAYKGDKKCERFLAQRYLSMGLPRVEQYFSWLKKFENTHMCKWTEEKFPVRGTIVLTRRGLILKPKE